MSKTSILVVDDHPLFRQGVVDALSLEPDILVLGQAASGEEALQMIRSQKPEVAVVDINLPTINGQQVVQQVIQEKLSTRVILLTAYDDPEQFAQAIRSGAFAYCAKDIEPEKLVNIIRTVAGGKYVLKKQILDKAGMDMWLEAQNLAQIRAEGEAKEVYSPLSGREMEVLTCVTKGLSNKEIAIQLGISQQTVKNHVTAILRKLGVEDRTQAAIYALQRGWVRLASQTAQSEE